MVEEFVCTAGAGAVVCAAVAGGTFFSGFDAQRGEVWLWRAVAGAWLVAAPPKRCGRSSAGVHRYRQRAGLHSARAVAKNTADAASKLQIRGCH